MTHVLEQHKKKQAEKQLVIHNTIQKRSVFYFSGFDARGARHYHALYASEAAIHNANNTTQLTVSPMHGDQNEITWDISARSTSTPGHATLTHTNYQFFVWDDIIRKYWPRHPIKHWSNYSSTIHNYLFCGIYQKLWKLNPAAAGLWFSPNLLLAGTLLLMLTASSASVAIVHAMTQSTTGSVLIGLLSIGLIWKGINRVEKIGDIGWIMRCKTFVARYARGSEPELEDRIQHIAHNLVAQVRAQSDDEILIVGHSCGAFLAISCLARAYQLAPDLFEHRTKVSLLTVGHCIHILGLLPQAEKFRTELLTLRQAKGMQWIDLSAPTDRVSFALLDPIETCGVDVASTALEIQSLSPQFHQQMTEEQYEKLKKNTRELHFQYLRATPGINTEYDYFDLTAGPLSLGKRFAPTILSDIPEDFDPVVYLKLNPDIVKMGQDPLWHWQHFGEQENRLYRLNLPAGFNAQTYLALNPDVAASGMDASLHYICHGEKEMRAYV